MATSRVRFQVLINGRPIAVTGIGDYGVLSAIVSWVRRNPAAISDVDRADPAFDEQWFLKERCDLHLGALDTVRQLNHSWAEHTLSPGDEITIRVLADGEYELPNADA